MFLGHKRKVSFGFHALVLLCVFRAVELRSFIFCNMAAPQLSPEYRRALEVFQQTLPEWQKFFSKSSMNIPLEQDYKQFFTVPVKKQCLPRNSRAWYWNQSNSRVQVTIFGRFEVKICKYNIRKTLPTDSAPSYKVWSFSAVVMDTAERFYFVWCEKGPSIPLSNKTELISSTTSYPCELTVASLSFLSPFADRETVASLGWGTTL